MQYLNLGCGIHFHPDWTNIDFESSGKDVIAFNLLKGIPFPDKSFDVVYHSHIIEHFTKDQAHFLIKESYRVLKSGGILRIATPDLELLVNKYLEALRNAIITKPTWDANYEWIILHLFDQVARNQPGGEMKKYLHSDNIPNMKYITSLMGSEATRIRESSSSSYREKLSSLMDKEGLFFLLRMVYRKIKSGLAIKKTFYKLVLGRNYELFQIGSFRKGGECHYWLYDRYSLRKLLEESGFTKIAIQSAIQSEIPDWELYHLDTNPDGSAYRPDSLYIEGWKK